MKIQYLSLHALIWFYCVNSYHMFDNFSHFSHAQSKNGTKKNFIETILIPLPFKPEQFMSPNDDFSDTFHVKSKPDKTFQDIGGYKDIKDELLQLRDIFDKKEIYKEYRLRTPRGILLEGPPGNGKTLMAKCFAGECDFSFIASSGSEFNEKYVGVGAARMRKLFETARKNQPAVIFIDELDVIGSKRVISEDGGGSEKYQTLNQLLVLMDGFDSAKDDIFVIGATNRKDVLDEALLRSGRFDKTIHVPNPDAETRREIIRIHSRYKPLDPAIDMEDMVELTGGLSGADIENLFNEACLKNIRENKIPVRLSDLENIRERFLVGYTVRKKNINLEMHERIAHHEVGHLLVAMACPEHEKPTKITIQTPGETTLGYTQFMIKNEVFLFNKTYLFAKIKTLLGGLVAEKIMYDDNISSGAIDDLERVKKIASDMVLKYHMSTKDVYAHHSEEYKRCADQQIQKLILDAKQSVTQLLSANKKLLCFLSKELLEHKTIEKKNLLKTIERGLLQHPSNDFPNLPPQ
ncbi:MAG: cell division protein FtsH [Rhodospirillaceae bacterium]|nr:cell division protein FtsH [Rhodospirillaceae bacterium]OUX67965.1 MAG: hypothetical protein CBD38_00675 [bacterium TMED178]